VGDDGGEQTAAYLEYPAEHEAGQNRPERPGEVTPVWTYVGEAEEEGGDHEPELLQHRPPEERLLAYARKDGDEHEIP
jgi:hypothetical protein